MISLTFILCIQYSHLTLFLQTFLFAFDIFRLCLFLRFCRFLSVCVRLRGIWTWRLLNNLRKYCAPGAKAHVENLLVCLPSVFYLFSFKKMPVAYTSLPIIHKCIYAFLSCYDHSNTCFIGLNQSYSTW